MVVGGGGLWSCVHHTVDVKILCSDVVRPSGCRFIFSVVVVALLFYVHGKHLRSSRDGQLT